MYIYMCVCVCVCVCESYINMKVKILKVVSLIKCKNIIHRWQ